MLKRKTGVQPPAKLLRALRLGIPTLLLIAASPARAAGTKPRENLLVNGDFEQGVQGWIQGDRLRLEGRFSTHPLPPPGQGAIGVIENRSDLDVVGVYQDLPFHPGTVYHVHGWCSAGPLHGNGGVAFRSRDASGKILQEQWVFRIPEWGTCGWQEFAADYQPPRKTARIELHLSLYRLGEIRFDHLSAWTSPAPGRRKHWAAPLRNAGWTVTRYATPKPVYRMAVADLDRDGAPELLLGGIDGILRCQELNGDIRWRVKLGGLPLALTVGDLDGDSKPEVLVCTADVRGDILAIDSRGAVLWRRPAMFRKTPPRGTPAAPPAPPVSAFAHVAVADLDRDGIGDVMVARDNTVAVLSGRNGALEWRQSFGGPQMRAVLPADVTGDGRLNVVAAVRAQRLFAAAFNATGPHPGAVAWRFAPVGFTGIQPETMAAADIDGDGICDVILGGLGGKIACIDSPDGQTAQLKWLAQPPTPRCRPIHRDAAGVLSSTPPQICVADFCPKRPGHETLVALLDSLWLLDSRGRFIWKGRSGILLLELHPWRDGSVFVPSSGFRDRSVYRIRLTRGRGNPLAAYAYPNPIGQTLDRLYTRIHQAPPLPLPQPQAAHSNTSPRPKFHVIYAGAPWPFHPNGSFESLNRLHALFQTLGSESLEYLLMLHPKDLPGSPGHAPLTPPNQIIETARFLESIKQPFLFYAARGATPCLSLPTIARVLQAAPTSCRGFYAARDFPEWPSQKWKDFVDWATGVMDLCLARTPFAKMVFDEPFDAWTVLPADPKVRERLFLPRYRPVTIALFATGDPQGATLQYGALTGLQYAEFISQWGIHTQYEAWNWSQRSARQQFGNICPADVILRTELTAACLGARWFLIDADAEYLANTQPPTVDPRAFHNRELVYELIRKRYLLPLSENDNLSFSDLFIARAPHPAMAAAHRDRRAIGAPVTRPASFQTGLLGVRQAVLAAPGDYLPSYAYGIHRYGQGLVPQTPYGLVRIVPATDRTAALLLKHYILRTNGADQLYQGAHPVSAALARPRCLHWLVRGAADLPFRAPGAAVFAHRLGKAWRVWLLDPGNLDPEGVNTILQVRSTRRIARVTDLITGKAIPGVEGRYPIHVPAGAFRILEVLPK